MKTFTFKSKRTFDGVCYALNDTACVWSAYNPLEVKVYTDKYADELEDQLKELKLKFDVK